ncbi:fibrinogen alpha-2 chain [Larimichthys crocea]|uniref:fibrinogen alpha-2 chain n=1 Tax=Larimichthys crocea TaxID=215358 RepID=UPI000F5F769D|nr:fibrinogen alpha-2 chain [Larimichthys crocea]
MKWCSILLTFVLLTGWCCQPVSGDFVTSDEHPDVGHDEDVHPNTLTETIGDVLDMDIQTSRDVLDTNIETNWDIRDNYEDADWHPPSSHLETHSDLSPEAPLVIHSSKTAVDDSAVQTFNQTAGSSSEHCGEYGSQLTSNGQCRFIATLPPVRVGTSQKSCPDMFRCTEDISHWLHENQNRKDHAAVRAAGAAPQPFGHRAGHEPNEHGLHDQGHPNYTAAQHARHAATRYTYNRHSDRQYLSLCPSDCASLYHNGVRRSGVYNIALTPGTTLPVYCDMETEGGGWMVFQRRRDGSVSFNRGWSEYRGGFGDPRGEHWLGNQQLHLLSNHGHYSLRIDLQDWSHAHKHALYHTFRIDNEENRYRLHVSGFSGTVEDSFGWYHNQQSFSTPDTGNICAEISHAGWWFHQCFYANLNGVYYKVGHENPEQWRTNVVMLDKYVTNVETMFPHQGGRYSLKAQNLLGPDGIVWFSWKDSDFYSLKAVTMMIRPRNFRPHLSP